MILATAAESNADVIVMGSVGRSALDIGLLGSVVEKVLRKAPCHVLMVKLEPHSGD
ncbi:MAG: universal stress protein [Candidatus Binatia bacterium]|nr:universal stress protein [Candidatus Binatia bacterium]